MLETREISFVIRVSTFLALALRGFLGLAYFTSVRLGVSEDGDWRFTVLCAFVFTIYHFSPGVFSIRNALNNKAIKQCRKPYFSGAGSFFALRFSFALL